MQGLLIDYESFLSFQDGRPKDPNRHIVYTTVEIFVVDFDDQGAKFAKYTYYATVEEGFHNVSIQI